MQPRWFQNYNGEECSASRGVPVASDALSGGSELSMLGASASRRVPMASSARLEWFRRIRTSDARPRGHSDGEQCTARGEEGSKKSDLRCRAVRGPASASDGDRQTAGRERGEEKGLGQRQGKGEKKGWRSVPRGPCAKRSTVFLANNSAVAFNSRIITLNSKIRELFRTF